MTVFASNRERLGIPRKIDSERLRTQTETERYARADTALQERTVTVTTQDLPAPTVKMSVGYLIALVFAWLGIWMALFTPLFVTLPLRIAELAPSSKDASLSLVLSLGAIIAMISFPIMGSLSDRTTCRWGRRRPWILAGMIGGATSTLLMAEARSIPVIAFAWCAVQVTTNCCNVPLMASLSESVPKSRQGQVASIVGVTMAAAPIVGSLLVHVVYGHRVLMFILPLSIGLVSIPWLLLVMRDRPATPIHSSSGTGRELLQFFWIDLKKWPDFGWALANRFFLYFGYAFFFSYQAYFLLDRLHYRTADVAPLVFVSATLTGVLLIALSQPLGWWSDRIGARKPFVIASTLATGGGMAILAFSPNLKLFLLGATLTGVGQGVHVSSSLALASDILPVNLSARGMGILSSGALLAQALAPLVAPHLLRCGEANPNYSLLFLVAFVSSVIGAACIVPVRSAR